ncbi:hypothetical protein ACFLV4_06920 [Chloroflexota bacterium]
MNMQRLARSDYLKLAPILALAFYIAFIPHQNYAYPLHLDEWQNLAYFQALTTAGSITFPDPYLGSAPGYPNLEVGFHVFWSVFHQLSDVPWLIIFRYFPSVIFMMSVLSVYTLGRREGFGWEAALMTCLIPTTVGILGPAFLVPVAMGLVFIPLSIFIAFNFRGWGSYAVLSIFMSLLVAMHAATALGLIIILTPYILLNLKGNFRHSFGIALAMAIPFLGLFPWIRSLLLPTAKLLLTPFFLLPYVEIPRVIESYGYIPILVSLVGTFVLSIRGGKKSYGLILGLLALLLMLVIRYTFHYGVRFMYERGLIYMMLMLSIVTGAGLAWVQNIRLPLGLMARLKALPNTRNVGYVISLILIGLTLYVAIPVRQNTPYYRMIDGEDYEAFMWIKENVDSSYSKAILDPWKATSLTAITEKNVYSRISESPRPSDKEAYDFLRSGSANTTFLRKNRVSIIYTRVFDGRQNVEYNSDNPDLTKVRKNIYLLKEDLAR